MSVASMGTAQREVSAIAMTVVLISLSMLFATLFLSYALYRSSVETWPPADLASINLTLPTLNSVLIAASSATYVLYQRASRFRALWWSATLILGAAFLAFQVQFWQALKVQGLFAGTHVFSSVLYGFTWIHAAHLALGIVALFFVSPWKGRPGPASISNVGKFWHFLGATWFLLYVGLFLF